MKKVVIIEDEVVAANNLQRQLLAIDPAIEVLATLQTIEDSVDYFLHHDTPDLVFMDIHLADGSAFAIFDQVELLCPIIFTTAYDQYALEAFKVNSIDYLLKPIGTDSLRRALDKFQNLTGTNDHQPEQLQQLIALLQQQSRHYKRYILIPSGERLVPFPVNQIAFVYLGNTAAYIYDYEGHPMAYSKPLDAIVEELDPQLFFRANRQYIVAHHAVRELILWPIGKLKLHLTVDTPEPIIISRARAAEFKGWYTQ